MSLCGRWKYDPITRKRRYEENKEPHYHSEYHLDAAKSVIAQCRHVPEPPTSHVGHGGRGFSSTRAPLPPPVQERVVLTPKNSYPTTRIVQAQMLEAAGFIGPVKSGEARCLKNLLTKIGKPDNIRYSWRMAEKKHRWSTKYMGLKGPCYLFKSPIPGIDFKDFIMLARMYKHGKGLRNSVKELMKRIPEELKVEAETFRTVDILAGLGENAA